MTVYTLLDVNTLDISVFRCLTSLCRSIGVNYRTGYRHILTGKLIKKRFRVQKTDLAKEKSKARTGKMW